MDCVHGGAVTLTAAPPDYRLRLSTDTAVVWVLLSRAELMLLQERIHLLLAAPDED